MVSSNAPTRVAITGFSMAAAAKRIPLLRHFTVAKNNRCGSAEKFHRFLFRNHAIMQFQIGVDTGHETIIRGKIAAPGNNKTRLGMLLHQTGKSLEENIGGLIRIDATEEKKSGRLFARRFSRRAPMIIGAMGNDHQSIGIHTVFLDRRLAVPLRVNEKYRRVFHQSPPRDLVAEKFLPLVNVQIMPSDGNRKSKAQDRKKKSHPGMHECEMNNVGFIAQQSKKQFYDSKRLEKKIRYRLIPHGSAGKDAIAIQPEPFDKEKERSSC